MTTSNHRTRVGIERRQKMRQRLIESALRVFSEKGVDASVIDDVIVAAGVSRGTFYNYFKTTSELLAAVGETLSDEVLPMIETVVGNFQDPVETLACGLRKFLHTMRDYPMVSRFIWRAGFNMNSTGNLIYVFLPRHITKALDEGSIKATDAQTALEIIIGICLVANFSISMRPTPDDYPEQMVRHILLALGLKAAEANRLTALPMPAFHLPDDSLLKATLAYPAD